MKKFIAILLLSLTISSTAYANLDSEWQVTKKNTYTHAWEDLRVELEREFPIFHYEFMEETKGNLYFTRGYEGKHYLQNINKKSGNIYQFDFNAGNWKYQGSIDVTDSVYGN